MNPSELHARAGPAAGEALRRRFQLLRLLGKSHRSMAWRVCDSQRADSEQFLFLPRAQPCDHDALVQWELRVRRAARLRHPNLAPSLEVGVCDRWPYLLVDAGSRATLLERIQARAMAASDACRFVIELLQGLAFAHDGGVAHRDLQPWMVLVDDAGGVSLAGLEVALHADPVHREAPLSGVATSVDALELTSQRQAAVRDVLCTGLLLHQALCGEAALGVADTGEVVDRLPPAGRDLVRLPWSMASPVPEALRAIVNRSTDRQPRQRYRSARALLRALEGWQQAEGAGAGGPLALLLDRLHSAGALPAAPGQAARAVRLAGMDRQRTNELAQVVLQDPALACEMLRLANSAQLRALQVGGGAAVLTVRRAIAMVGMDGLRRAATALRPWPGPLPEAAAQALEQMLRSTRRAGRLAQALRPAGYDAEMVMVVALLQNLGRLVAAYHFPDELQQMRRLMQPAAAAAPGAPAEAGMSEQAASFAVLGADIEALGAAVARHWGFDDSVLHLARRMPLTSALRAIDSDDDMLRAVASCGHEVADALRLPEAQQPAALRRVVLRYGRGLHLQLRDIEGAIAATAREETPATREPEPAPSAA